MKQFIVISDGFDKNLFETFKDSADFEVYPESKISQDKLKELLPKINGLIIRSATKVTSELLDQAPNLKYVIRAGEGTDNIDKPECRKRGITVSNTPGANANSAAEHAIALLFSVLRKTAFANQSMSEKKWEKPLFSGNEVWKKKVGVIGFGKIGQIFAKRLSGFEIDLHYFDAHDCSDSFPGSTKAKNLNEIFSNCDIISIHLPLLEGTKGLIKKEQFDLMKKDAVLVNASRGGIVNESDLYNALSEKKFLGAGFDVFSNEPLESESKLYELENIVLTPHLGASTAEAQVRVGEMAVDQIKEFFLKDNPKNVVN